MTRGGAGSVYLSRREPELVGDPGCTGAIECTLVGLADHVLLLLWFLLMIAVAVGSLVFLPRARELCDRERQRTRAEFDAFERFVERVRNLTPAKPSTPNVATTGRTPLLHQQSMDASGDLSTLTTAYEETVMAVPHFEEEYGETIDQHMREELGDEIAEAVQAESQLSEPLYRSVLDAAVAAKERRAQFLEMLDAEADSLATRERQLREMTNGLEAATTPLCADQTFDELHAQRERLENYERRIERLVNERQEDRTEGQIGMLRTRRALDLQSYLYEPMEPTYPVVAEAARLLSRIKVTLRRVEDELIYRG